MVTKKGQGKRWQTRNRTNPNTNTPSQQRARANAAIDGRTANAAFTAGARSVDTSQDNAKAMRRNWEERNKVDVYTKTSNGLLSANGRNTKDAKTWTFTDRDMEGNFKRQSGRSKMADRRQRDYDVKSGMNNISPRVVEAWLRTGLARAVNGRLVGDGGNVIRQRADGTYSMGLSTG